MAYVKFLNWMDALPDDVYFRLGSCCSRKDDIQILVDCKWDAMKEKHGFTKEDALVYVLDLLDCNGQFFDLTKDEYNELIH